MHVLEQVPIVVKILKKRFNNLGAEEIVNLAIEIVEAINKDT